MRQFTVYVDEAGDEGFGKLATKSVGGQSRWLILGACIVSHEDDPKLPTWRNAIIDRFPRKKSRHLHFRDLNHAQKVVVCQEISSLPLRVGLVMSHKVQIPGTRYANVFKTRGSLYSYLIRRLVARVYEDTRARHGETPFELHFVFSKRATMDQHGMVAYFRSMREGQDGIGHLRMVDWDAIPHARVRVEDHSKWAGLQFADCVTSAFFNAVEPNVYGNYEWAYAHELCPTLVAQGRWPSTCGIVLVPPRVSSGLDDRQHGFFDGLKKKRQAPGS